MTRTMDAVALLPDRENDVQGSLPRAWLPPGVPAPPPPPVSLSALVAWVETLPDLVLLWTTPLPASGSSYLWSELTPCASILLSSALEAHPRECKTILAHEVGHHFTLRGSFGDAQDRSLADGRNECQACRIAARLLVPAGCRAQDIRDLCEEYDVLAETVMAAACASGLGPVPGLCPQRRPRRMRR